MLRRRRGSKASGLAASMLFPKSTDRRWMDRPTHELMQSQSGYMYRPHLVFIHAGGTKRTKRNTHLLQHPDVDATAKGVSTRNASATKKPKASASQPKGARAPASAPAPAPAAAAPRQHRHQHQQKPSLVLQLCLWISSQEGVPRRNDRGSHDALELGDCSNLWVSTDLSAAAQPQSTRRILNATPVGRRKGKKQPPPIYTPVKVNRLELNLAYIDASEFCVEQAYKRAGVKEEEEAP